MSRLTEVAEKLKQETKQEGKASSFWSIPNWSPNEGQSRAIKQCVHWYKNYKPKRSKEISMGEGQWNRDQIFLIYGYAGTGKTSVVPFIMDELGISPHKIAYMTFTGKAALVLSQKLGHSVGTIHSQIYRLVEDPITKQQSSQLRYDSPVRDAKLIVLDEVSMVNTKIMADLLSFGVPIVCLGDPFQLPPVGGDVFFTEDLRPDVFLEEITRVALENPVIWLSMQVREKGFVQQGVFGDRNIGLVWVGNKQALSESTYLQADQMICGYNRTRVEWNQWFRDKLGMSEHSRDILPKRGDKLICLKNNYNLGVVNGMMLTALSDAKVQQGSKLYFNLSMTDQGFDVPEDYLEAFIKVKRGESAFGADEEDYRVLRNLRKQYREESQKQKEMGLIPSPDYSNLGEVRILADQQCYTGWVMNATVPEHLKVHWSDLKNVVELDYGYVISGHKAQGSGWKNVLVLDEPPFRGDQNMNTRWRYTCITRTEKNLVYVI